MAGNLAEKDSRTSDAAPLAASNVPRFSQSENPQGALTRKKLPLRLIVTSILLLALVASAAFGVNELSKMPRERAQANYSYPERVWYGLKMFTRMVVLSASVEPDPYPNTKLPVIDLSVSKKISKALDAKLPQSGTVQQSGASISFGGQTFPAEVRYSGISINHWGMPWKSWGIKIAGGAFDGMQNFTLMMPRADTQFENWLGNVMARRLGGILTPESEFIHFRLNGKLNGVRLLTEPVGVNFPVRRKLPPGKLFGGDITTAQIYGGVRRERLFSEKAGWEVTSPFPEDQGSDDITKLIDVVQRLKNPYDFYYNLAEVMEVDSLVRYMALLEMVSSVHIDETHNWKLYLNPETKRFSPVIWNSVAYYWKNTKSIDLAPNDLFRVVLSNPGLREKKDHYLWDSMQGVLSAKELRNIVESEAARIKPDLYASALKWEAGDRGIRLLSNPDWDESIQTLLRVIDERHEYLRRELLPTKASYRVVEGPSNNQIAIKVESRSGLYVEEMKFALSPPRAGVSVTIVRRGLADVKAPIRADRQKITATSARDGTVSLKVNDTLTSKRRIQKRESVSVVPATYVYEVTLPRGVSIEKMLAVEAHNSITGERYMPLEDTELQIPARHVPNIVWWEPSEFVVQEK